VADDDGRPDWHDQRGLIWAAGVAAVALICLLVYAVIRVSSGSSLLPGGPPSATSFSNMPSTTGKTTSTTTSYTVPSVQTSEDTGPPVTVPSTEEAPGSDDTTTTSTTIYNPYGTTTPTNAGHI
jgi:hypothetical protein